MLVNALRNEMAEAESKFMPSFDKDGDGLVSKDELQAGLDKMPLTEEQKKIIIDRFSHLFDNDYTHLTDWILTRMA